MHPSPLSISTWPLLERSTFAYVHIGTIRPFETVGDGQLELTSHCPIEFDQAPNLHFLSAPLAVRLITPFLCKSPPLPCGLTTSPLRASSPVVYLHGSDMFAVSSTRWSPTLATLLLVMSTTLQPFLLPTVQASVISGTVRQMWRPSMGSNSGLTKDRSTLATGRLGQSDDFSPDALNCLDSFEVEGSDANVTLAICAANQESWVKLIEDTEGENSTEYQCKALYCEDYCTILVGNSFCTANQSAALLKDVQKGDFDGNAETCKPWASWIPPMESLPKMTSEFTKCFQTIQGKEDVMKCLEMIPTKNATTVDERTELQCKKSFGVVKCTIDAVCKYCPSSASKILSFQDQFWTPAKVECTKWSNDKPKYECPVASSSSASVSVTTSSSNTPMIVGIIIGVLVLLVAIGVAVYCLCFSTDKSAGPSSKAGSGGSRASSKVNSGKAGSTMGSKQQSRIEAKQSSRA